MHVGASDVSRRAGKAELTRIRTPPINGEPGRSSPGSVIDVPPLVSSCPFAGPARGPAEAILAVLPHGLGVGRTNHGGLDLGGRGARMLAQ